MRNEEIELITTDQRFQQLKFMQEKSNVFSIVGQTHTEHWHSSFLSWLFDPHSSMNLGHYALARLLNIFLARNENADFTLKDLYKLHLDDVKFVTELTFFMGKGGKRSIDVYGESDELVIVIENKVTARENYNDSSHGQTQDYYDHVEAHKKEGQRSFYFFITPDSKQKASCDAYMRITYQEMYDNVIAKCLEHPQLCEESRSMLEQYAANLREPVNHSPMALVNIGICNSLYDDYKDCFEEIFRAVENSSDVANDDNIACAFYNRYSKVFDEIYLSADKCGRTPKSGQERNIVSFDDLFKSGKISEGTKFVMQYAGVEYYAVAELVKGVCYMRVLDENKKPIEDEKGNKFGYYVTSSQAGMDLINRTRRKNGSAEPIKSLRGTTYWKLEDGRTINDLINS